MRDFLRGFLRHNREGHRGMQAGSELPGRSLHQLPHCVHLLCQLCLRSDEVLPANALLGGPIYHAVQLAMGQLVAFVVGLHTDSQICLHMMSLAGLSCTTRNSQAAQLHAICILVLPQFSSRQATAPVLLMRSAGIIQFCSVWCRAPKQTIHSRVMSV